MMEWKYKVGDIVASKDDDDETFEVTGVGLLIDGLYFYNIVDWAGRIGHVFKNYIEGKTNLIKPKSLYEQTLDLLGVKIDENFYIDGLALEYKIDKYGRIHFYVPQYDDWSLCHITLMDILLGEYKISTKQYKPKSEAELILEELKTTIDKANEILGRGEH